MSGLLRAGLWDLGPRFYLGLAVFYAGDGVAFVVIHVGAGEDQERLFLRGVDFCDGAAKLIEEDRSARCRERWARSGNRRLAAAETVAELRARVRSRARRHLRATAGNAASIRRPARHRFARRRAACARGDRKVWPAIRRGENGAGRASGCAAEFQARDRLCLLRLPNTCIPHVERGRRALLCFSAGPSVYLSMSRRSSSGSAG